MEEKEIKTTNAEDSFNQTVEDIREALRLLSKPEVRNAIAHMNHFEASAVSDAVKAVAIQDAVKAVAIQDAVKAVTVQDAVKAVAIQDAVKAVAIQDAVKAVAIQDAVKAVAVQDAVKGVIFQDQIKRDTSLSAEASQEIKSLIADEVKKALAVVMDSAKSASQPENKK